MLAGIRDLITGLLPSPSRTASTKAAHPATTDWLRARVDAASQEITRLHAENATLREQAARQLGQQRAQERGTPIR
jgi:cell division protein FtsB